MSGRSHPPYIPLRPHLETVPGTLRPLRQWVVWKFEWVPRRHQWSKVPYNPCTACKANSTDPETWASFDRAAQAYSASDWDGVGFVFAPGGPFAGIDLDDCTAEDGHLMPWAHDVVSRLDSYTERSPSGRGLHIIVRAQLPPGRRRKGQIEMYDAERYFTADMILRLKRPDGGTRATVRELQALGRFPAEESVMIELSKSGYMLLGTDAAVQRRDCEAFLLEQVRPLAAGISEADAEEEATRAKELEDKAEERGFGRTLVQDVLKRLTEEGLLCRKRLSGRGRPYVYWKPVSFLSSALGDEAVDEREEGTGGSVGDRRS